MKQIVQAGILLVVTTIISGILYPLLVTGIGQLIWADQCNGSLINKDGRLIGSSLIAQGFTKSKYFWPRPSASNFNTLPSAATNLGPTSAELAKSIAHRRRNLSITHEGTPIHIPMDLLTASGSGLDPHISREAARIQVRRIIEARGLNRIKESAINKLIDDHLENPPFWLLGEKRINVLSLNLALDREPTN
jgi:potassium-transporting ATPase KdpC subunit